MATSNSTPIYTSLTDVTSRDRHAIDPSGVASDVTAELKRLRRENEILRQERDILKKATAFFVREGSR